MSRNLTGVGAGALLIGGLFVLALSTFFFWFGWNVFIVGVLEFSRTITIIEALAGMICINTIIGAVGAMFKNWMADNK